MEAVGGASAILELVKTAVALAVFIKDVVESEKNKEKVWRSIEQLQKDLEWLYEKRKLIGPNSPAANSFSRLYDEDEKGGWQPSDLLKSIDALFDKMKKKLGVDGPEKAVHGWKEQTLQKFRRTGKAIAWPFDEKSVAKQVEELNRYHHQLDSIIMQATFELGLQTNQGIEDLNRKFDGKFEILFNSMQDMQRNINDRNSEDDFTRALKWISSAELLNPARHVAEDERVPGSWLVKSDVFQAWMKGRQWNLMLYGDPGLGKTMLSAFVVGYLKESFLPHQSCLVLSLFLKYEEQESQTLDRLLGLLAKQTLLRYDAHDAPQDIVQTWREQIRSSAQPDTETSSWILASEVQKTDRTFIVIDGLDEAEERTRNELVTELERLQPEESAGVQKLSILYTSRPREGQLSDNSINCDNCSEGKNLSIYFECQAHSYHRDNYHLCQNCADEKKRHDSEGNEPCDLYEPYSLLEYHLKPPDKAIASYVEALLKKAKTAGLGMHKGDFKSRGVMPNASLYGTTPLARALSKLQDPDLEKDIVDEIVENAKGLFLLARAQWERVKDSDSRAKIEDALEELPTDPNFIYERALKRMKSEQGEEAAKKGFKLLRWVYYSKRMMTYKELEHALKVDVDLFLQPKPEKWSKSKRSRRIFDKDDVPADIHGHVAATAGLIHLSDDGSLRLMHRTAYQFFDNEAKRKEFLPGNGHRELALTSLAYLLHTGAVESVCSGDSEEYQMVNKVKSLPFAAYATQFWGSHVSAVQEDQEVMKHALGFLDDQTMLAAAMQISSFCEYQQPSGWDVRKGASQIHVAAWFGLDSIIDRYVLRAEESEIADSYGRTPLIYACRNGNYKTIRNLLDLGANVNTPDKAEGLSPLRHAVERNKAGSVAELCRSEYDVNINLIESDDASSLMRAATLTSGDVVRALATSSELEVNLRNSKGNSALHYGASLGSAKTLQTLLSLESVDINIQNNEMKSALHLATYYNRDAAVRELLEAGADADAKDAEGFTPLMWAVLDGYKAIVERFAKHKAITADSDVGRNGWTLLHAASHPGHRNIARWLLDRGVNVNALDAKGRSPLHLAAEGGHSDVIRLLLDAGCDKAIRNQAGETAAESAVSEGFPEAAHVIDPSVDQNDFSSLTLPMMAKRGRLEHLKQRIDESPASLEDTDENGNTALHQAVNHGHEDCVEAILDASKSRSSIDFINHKGDSPLYIACKGVRPNIVTQLVAHEPRPDVNRVDSNGESLLGISLAEEDFESAVALVGAGARLDRENSIPHDVLSAAIDQQNKSAVMNLVKHGIVTDSGDRIQAQRTGNRAIISILNRVRTIHVGEGDQVRLDDDNDNEEEEKEHVDFVESPQEEDLSQRKEQLPEEDLIQRLQDADLAAPQDISFVAGGPDMSKPMFRSKEEKVPEAA